MKKYILLIISILLFGCSSKNLKNIPIDYTQYSNPFDNMAVGISENGIYYINDDLLYFKSDYENTVSLGSMNYINGNKGVVTLVMKDVLQIDSYCGRDIICYGDRLYLQYYTDKFDGSRYYSLCSVNQKNEDFQIHIVFDFIPQRIVMTNGKIYVQYHDENNSQFINVYDSNFKLIDTKQYDDNKNTTGFYIIDDEIIVPDRSHTYVKDDIDVSYKIENLYSDQDRKILSTYRNGDYTLTFENKLILFVNDKYFYTSSCTYPQTYERYKLNGELDSSITIKDHLESKGNFDHFFTTDFSYIIKLKNPDIGYGHSDNHIFEVDFSKGECYYVED